jgi:hypothetical protein
MSTRDSLIKAIVLTCDTYRSLTEHMIVQYARLWPDHPFVFRVPYQEARPAAGPRREFVRSPVAIKATVATLLDDLDDEDWIYWCIDDKYPIALDLPRIREITRWIGEPDRGDISGVLFCRCRKLLRREYLKTDDVRDPRGRVYLERTGYEQIWIHQFLRAKVLRHLFQQFPDDIPRAMEMDLFKARVHLPESHRLLVSQENLAIFGESTSEGVLTQNCYDSIVASRLPLPEWCSRTNGRRIILGEMGSP